MYFSFFVKLSFSIDLIMGLFNYLEFIIVFFNITGAFCMFYCNNQPHNKSTFFYLLKTISTSFGVMTLIDPLFFWQLY